jgi:hypothetical protein
MIYSTIFLMEFLLLNALDLELETTDLPGNQTLESSEEIPEVPTNCRIIETRLYTRISILNLKLLKAQQTFSKKIEALNQQIPSNFNSTIEGFAKKFLDLEKKVDVLGQENLELRKLVEKNSRSLKEKIQDFFREKFNWCFRN